MKPTKPKKLVRICEMDVRKIEWLRQASHPQISPMKKEPPMKLRAPPDRGLLFARYGARCHAPKNMAG